MNSREIDVAHDFTEEEEAAFIPEGIPDEDRLVMLYRMGVPNRRLCKEFKISSGKLYEILNRHKVSLRKGRNLRCKSAQRITTMTTEEKKNLVKDYLNGMTLTEIYDKYGVNKHGCYAILDEQDAPRKYKTTTKAEREEQEDQQAAEEIDEVLSSSTKSEYESDSDSDSKAYVTGNTLVVHVNKQMEEPVDINNIDLTISVQNGDGKHKRIVLRYQGTLQIQP